MLAAPANIPELLEARVESTPDKDFLLVESGNHAFTYRQFNDEVNRAANTLLELRVGKGDRVSLLLTNRAEYLTFYFACFKIGAWAGPVNALLKPQEIAFIIADSEARTVVTQPDMLSHLDEARERVAALRHLIVIEGDNKRTIIDNDSELGKNASGSNPEPQTLNPELNRDDEAVIIYTSGTTGKPKGVLLTHGNLLSNAQQIAEWLRLTAEDRSLIVMPLFHVNALMTTAMATLWAGGSIVLAPRFSASRHWETISRYGVTYFGSVATMLSMLNHRYPEGLPAGLGMGRFRFALCGSAPVPVEVLKTFESLFKFPVIEGYGLSESTCRATFNPLDERRVGSVGKPIGNDIRIFDEDDREVAPHQVGEIVLRGPNIMKGYYRNEAATREAFRSGWFHTGDLGYCDEDGFFYVVDRKSDLIIRAGENIYPREIDEVLYQHPGVKDAATVGVPHELYGEEVKAFVVPHGGAQITEALIIEFCRERLADFKCPKSVEFVEDIPKGPTGKLLKRELIRDE
jgi:acyl-CoA synthetase (AMP-forming)/AMP-acid ligase II